ncbi:hypothetical protein EI613_24765 [Azospirillum sp. 412522]|nr:hypothetical protein [Azospirillum sp. 412522]MBY6265107.1 hypothetical protein [Azospirillum sp. 412522]
MPDTQRAVVVQIDGIGRVNIGANFLQKSPDEQNAIIQDIHAQVTGNRKGGSSKEATDPDTSFSSAFASGIDAPLENLGVTAEMMGFNSTGKFLRNLTSAPKNYANASEDFLNKGNEGFNWSSLPRAAVEQGGQLLGGLLTRAAGSAVGGAMGSVVPGVGNAAGAAAGAFAGPALFGALQTVGPVALERAQHNGRETPNEEDWKAAIMVAGASGALDAFGVGKLFKGGSLVGNVAREGVANAGQSAVQQVGSTVGTDDGAALDLKQAVGEGIIGGASAGGLHAGVAVAAAPARAAGAVRDMARMGQIEEDFNTHPDQAASALRVQQLYEQRRATVDNRGSDSRQPDSVTFKDIADDLSRNLREATDSLVQSGAIDKEGRGTILSAISEAARHNREPGSGGESAGYFDTLIDRVNGLGLDEGTTKTLQESLRDLNTAVSQSKQKNMRGRFEVAGAKLGKLAAGASAAALPFTGGATAAGLLGPAIGKTGGRVLDKFFGTQTADLLRTADARRRYAEKVGISGGDTVQAVKGLKEGAQATVRQQADERAQHLEDFRQTQAELIARNEVPGGGIYKAIYDHIGLKPLEVQRGLETLVQRGSIDSDTVNAFHNDPRSLMDGNRGLALQNRLQGLVAEGVLQRDPQAVPAVVPGSSPTVGVGNPAAPVGASGAPAAAPHIRNPQAYQATIDAALATHGAIQGNPSLPDQVKAAGAEIAQAKTKGEKLTILNQFLSSLPPDQQEGASLVLMPLTGYGAKDGPLSGVLKAPQRAPVSGATRLHRPRLRTHPRAPLRPLKVVPTPSPATPGLFGSAGKRWSCRKSPSGGSSPTST